MSDDADARWMKLIQLYRRSQHLPPTDAELDAFCEDSPLTKDEIDAAIEFVMTGGIDTYTPFPDVAYLNAVKTNVVAGDVAHLNRNRRDKSDALKKKLEDYRMRLLSKRPSDDDDNMG